MQADPVLAPPRLRDEFASGDCGFEGWPWDAPPATPLPPLPHGAAWPDITVVTAARAGAISEATRRSVAQQGYPACTHVTEPGGDAAVPGFVLWLPDGDMLAPGALAAAALAAVCERASSVVGLRVQFDAQGVWAVDILDDAPGDGGTGPNAAPGIMGARRPAAPGRRVAIGRPMILSRADRPETLPGAPRLNVVALTEAVAGGGAAIAHRRMIGALRFARHRVEALTLPVSPATAEWTDAFPAVEARIEAGGFDLLLAGNIHGATRRADVLARLHRHVPVAAVTHDMFLLSGRCDASVDCPMMRTRCTAACPSPTAYPYLAPGNIEAAWQGKRDFLAMTPPPLLLANSQWAADFSKEVLGPALGGIVQRIDLAFPTQVFRPAPRGALRRALDLPADDVLILFAAVNSDNPQKGLSVMLAALRGLARPGVGFVVVGRVDDPAALTLANLFAPGPIADEAVLAQWYAACDLHVTASRFESLGQTPIEAGLCGTPTVAYRRTGLSTAVIDGISGRLTEPDPEHFAHAVRALVDDRAAREALGALGRIALESRNSFAGSYLSMLAAWRAHGLVPPAVPGGRVDFDPAILRSFAGAADPWPGASGTVAARPGCVVRVVRRAKHAVWGRTMPLWMRLAVRLGRRMRGLERA